MDASLEPAAEILRQSLQTMENNAPINRAEGNHLQATLEEQNAVSIRAALQKLAE